MPKHTIKKFIVLFLISPLFAACGNGLNMGDSADLGNIGSSTDASTDDNNDNGDGSTDNSNTTISNKVVICSDLTLTGVVFPSDLSTFAMNTFALAINMTGSFEGHSGWDNISNNFDGQGLSLGLFNQNLGQGSLQPLLLTLRDTKNTKMKSFFTSAQYTSLNGMMTQWGGVSSALTKAVPMKTYDQDFSDLDDMDAVEAAEGPDAFRGNSLDEEDESNPFSKAAVSKIQASVNWAVANLYTGSSFKSAWQTSLQKMARSPEYISLQVKAAESIHKKAKTLMSTYSFKSMRAYLFLFDIVVQNGGISSSVQTKYMTWVKANSKASEDTRLKKLLEYRLTLVLSQYRADVKARKTAIIVGSGTVHGSKRNFPKEYCVGDWSAPYADASLNLM